MHFHFFSGQDVDASKLFQEQASALYERATTGVLKKSMLLHFAYADFEEQNLKNDKVHQIYQKFFDIEDIDPTLVSVCTAHDFHFRDDIYIAGLYPVHEV